MKHILKTILFFLLALPVSAVYAGDTITVRKDTRLDVLAAKQSEINKRFFAQAANGLYKGYRIQVLSTFNRDQAFAMQSSLMAGFPEQKTYVTYQSPNFRVRIGNFLSREDAEAFRKQLSRYYPEGLYIVEDAVELVLTDPEETIVQ
jgi:hypothetical protein